MNTNLYSTINQSTIKSTARATTFERLIAAAKEIFGEENISVVGNGEFAINTGSAPNGNEVCTTVYISAKDYMDRQTRSKAFLTYDRFAAAKTYEENKAKGRKKRSDS